MKVFLIVFKRRFLWPFVNSWFCRLWRFLFGFGDMNIAHGFAILGFAFCF